MKVLAKKLMNNSARLFALGALSSALLSPLESRCQDTSAQFSGLGWVLQSIGAREGNVPASIIGQGMSAYGNALAGKSEVNVNVQSGQTSQVPQEFMRQQQEPLDIYLNRIMMRCVNRWGSFMWACNFEIDDPNLNRSFPNSYIGIKHEYPAVYGTNEPINISIARMDKKLHKFGEERAEREIGYLLYNEYGDVTHKSNTRITPQDSYFIFSFCTKKVVQEGKYFVVFTEGRETFNPYQFIVSASSQKNSVTTNSSSSVK